MTIKIALLGTGYHANLKTSLNRISNVEILELPFTSYNDLIDFGSTAEIPLLIVCNDSGLSSSNLISLNKSGYILMFPLETLTVLNSLGPTTTFSRAAHSYVVSILNVSSNNYFEYLNLPKITIPAYNGNASYYLKTHPQLKPILYISDIGKVVVGVFEKLETNSGILPTPILYASFLNNSNPDANKDLIFKDIVLFAKNFTNPPYNVSGLVLDFNKEPIDRDIAVYSTTTNKLVGKSRSKEDGTYWVGLSKDEPVYVVAIPEENNNALVKYNIKPVPSY